MFIAPFKLTFVPAYRHVFNDYLMFDMNYATFMAVIYLGYYFLLEPVAAVSPATSSFSKVGLNLLSSCYTHHK